MSTALVWHDIIFSDPRPRGFGTPTAVHVQFTAVLAIDPEHAVKEWERLYQPRRWVAAGRLNDNWLITARVSGRNN